jgi:glycosyltransferase involved in cell wall biosynthesis/peptidoglycan/xylan/chitin deacetylase (PgdA/CDA1 family)
VNPVEPLISVVIPTRDRSALLSRCLAALARQSIEPSTFEVIVVDDGSVDDTPRVVAEYSAPYRLRVTGTPGLGPGAARNHGVELSAAPLILFLDDDIEAAADLVAEHLQAHEAPSVVAIGRLEARLRPGAGGIERHLARWWTRHDERIRSLEGRPDWTDCYGANVSVERAAFVAVGRFAADLRRSEDVELGYRLHEAGHQFMYLERAVGWQTVAKRQSDLLHDAEAAGTAGLELWRRHPAMLPGLELARFSQVRRRAAVARRILFRTGLRGPTVALIGWLRLPRAVDDRWWALALSMAYWRGVQIATSESGDHETWRRLTNPPAVLMYHAFGRRGEAGSRWVVPIRLLDWQLRLLRRLGRTVVPLGEIVEARRQHRLPPAGAIAITIDDGYRDVLEALPVFARAQAPVTLFVVSGRLGRSNDWDPAGPLAGRPILDADELAALDPERVSIGAHSRTHRDLTAIDEQAAVEEVRGSVADLAERGLLSIPATFAWPYGRVRPEIAVDVPTHVDAAVATHPGFVDPGVPLDRLPRIPVSGTDSLARFAAAVVLGDAAVLGRPSRRRSGSRRRPDVQPPTVAVVVATIGRPASLARCLAGLRDGARAPEEIIVVDQSVGPAIEQVVRDADTGWTRLRRIPTESLGVSRARNIGWRASAASIVAFTDDDCVPDRNWVSTIAESLGGDPELDGVTGRVLGLGEETPDLRAVSQRTSTSTRTYTGRSLPWRVGTGGNFAVRRATIARAGGFDERLGPGTDGASAEDLDVLYRLLRDGSRIRYDPRAVVYHELQPAGRRRQKRMLYGLGLGAVAGLTLRRGDPYGAVILGAWVATRTRLLVGATLRRDAEGAAERALDERLMLRGAWKGLRYGLGGPGRMPRDRGQRS